jgi:predicted transcriptional regulator
MNILKSMTTTVHLPDPLLERIDRKASELGISRNRLVIRAIERLLEEESAWSDSFLAELDEAARDRDAHPAIEAMRADIRRSRTRKRAPRL